MFSVTVEHALQAVVYLSSCNDVFSEPVSTEKVAADTGIPKPYLAKVLQHLVRKGITKSQRGIKGGVSLAKDPKTITLYEVVSSVEPTTFLPKPITHLMYPSQESVNLWIGEALETVKDMLSKTTIADLISRQKP